MRHQIVGFSLSQTFLHSAFHSDQTGTELVFSQFADTADTPIAKMVDIVNFTATIAQFDQNLDDRQNIVIGQRHRPCQLITSDAAVELHPADCGQVVTFLVIEQPIEQRFNGFFGRRFARTHHAVNGDSRGHLIGCFVHAKSLGNIRPLIQIIRIQRLDFGNTCFTQAIHDIFRNFIIGPCDDLAGILIDDIFGQRTPVQEIFWHGNPLDTRRLDITNMTCIDTFILFDQYLAVFAQNIETCDFATHTRWNEFHFSALWTQQEIVKYEEIFQNFFRCHANGLEQNRHWHLATAVDTEEQNIFRIEFEIKP